MFCVYYIDNKLLDMECLRMSTALSGRTFPEYAVEAKQLRKHFGKTKAVDGIDLKIPYGIVYGFLGPNGAGKTTTIRMLATLLRPDEGSVRVLGRDLIKEADDVRGRISLTGQLASADNDLSGRENLILIARLLGFSRRQAGARADELLSAFGLEDAAGRLVKKYSGGMRRRLDIAASIVTLPELLFLDEPTAGLDPHSRSQVWEIIRILVSAGTTVLLTTQYLDEADELADRIAVIDQGKVIAEGTGGEMKAAVGSGRLYVRLMDPTMRERAVQHLTEALGTSIQISSDPAALTARVSDTERAALGLAALTRMGIEVTDFSLGQPSLDEVFLSLTGHRGENNTEEGEA